MLTIDQDQLCRQLCSEVELVRRPDGKVMLDTPFRYPDGDTIPSTSRRPARAAFVSATALTP